ncbi:MAG: hypothetical protein AAF235_11190, partial [Planctomycetota bacterium]
MPWALAGLVLLTGVAFAASYTANPGSGHGPVIALARVVEVMAPATLIFVVIGSMYAGYATATEA